MTSAELTEEGQNGHGRTWLASFYPVWMHGELAGVGSIVVETTDKRELEQQLR